MRTLPLLLAVSLWLPVVAFGQASPIDKGSLIVGGNANLSAPSNGFNGDRSFNLTVSPSVQYFVAPGLALGGGVTLGVLGKRFAGGIGPKVSYFFKGKEERALYPFVSASASYFRAFGSDSGVADVSGGAVLMIAKNVGLTGEAFYTQDLSDEANNLGLRFGITAFVF